MHSRFTSLLQQSFAGFVLMTLVSQSTRPILASSTSLSAIIQQKSLLNLAFTSASLAWYRRAKKKKKETWEGVYWVWVGVRERGICGKLQASVCSFLQNHSQRSYENVAAFYIPRAFPKTTVFVLQSLSAHQFLNGMAFIYQLYGAWIVTLLQIVYQAYLYPQHSFTNTLN